MRRLRVLPKLSNQRRGRVKDMTEQAFSYERTGQFRERCYRCHLSVEHQAVVQLRLEGELYSHAYHRRCAVAFTGTLAQEGA